ncbi:MFS transporter [Rhodococcus pyridinivorans]|uniref:MFS transporter n=1 Tax=Rhodococcus pyridinivorans TaxID=103816 RepID=UPI002285125A|nr:MFS transporter [Rhodococcus pyridinivorans]WAL49543.1 MFS transporter [Rhodococcus pyridinivorans]
MDERRRVRRAAIAGGVGTLIEYYEFSVYGFLAIIVAPLFFPNADPVVALLSALAVFGVGYVVRPLGGLFFGYIGDRYGRKASLVLTLVFMGVGSAAMGLLPTYEQLGVAAAALLIAIRLLQGFSAGGELGGAATLISEAAPAREKAKYGAFTPMGGNGGFALAAAVVGILLAVTDDAQMQSWGWRIPFLMAVPLTIFCLWVRSRAHETHEPAASSERARFPIAAVITQEPVALLKATGISIATQGTGYIGLSYLSIHLINQLGYQKGHVYWVAMVVIAISALLMPFGGLLADRFGASRIIACSLVGYLAVAYPAMVVMDHGLLVAGVAYLAIVLNTVGTQVGAYTIRPQMSAKPNRYTSVATAVNLGVIIGGGSAPYVCVWLITQTGNPLAPAFFIIVAALVGLISLVGISRQVTKALGNTASPTAVASN